MRIVSVNKVDINHNHDTVRNAYSAATNYEKKNRETKKN
jgi:hypothetical protein